MRYYSFLYQGQMAANLWTLKVGGKKPKLTMSVHSRVFISPVAYISERLERQRPGFDSWLATNLRVCSFAALWSVIVRFHSTSFERSDSYLYGDRSSRLWEGFQHVPYQSTLTLLPNRPKSQFNLKGTVNSLNTL